MRGILDRNGAESGYSPSFWSLTPTSFQRFGLLHWSMKLERKPNFKAWPQTRRSLEFSILLYQLWNHPNFIRIPEFCCSCSETDQLFRSFKGDRRWRSRRRLRMLRSHSTLGSLDKNLPSWCFERGRFRWRIGNVQLFKNWISLCTIGGAF